MDLVKRIPGMVIVLLVLSKAALCQSSTISYSFNIQMAPDCEGYKGQLFCTVAYGKSLDTFFMKDEPLIFRDSLPKLCVSLYAKPIGGKQFLFLASFDSLVGDTSYLPPLAASELMRNPFFENDSVILMTSVLLQEIRALESRSRIQLKLVKTECRPRRGINCVVALCEGHIFDTQTWSSISVLDLRTQGQWLLPRE